jgi:hypothetical protein
MRTDGFTMETEFSYGLLVGPQSVLEPLSLASVRSAMERGGAGYVSFSLETPERFQSTAEPRLRHDVRLELLVDGRMATTLILEHSVDPDEEEESDRWQDDIRALLGPLLRSTAVARYRSNATHTSVIALSPRFPCPPESRPWSRPCISASTRRR